MFVFHVSVFNLVYKVARVFFRCAGLILPSSGVNILAVALAILWGALPIPEIIGLSGRLVCVS